MVQYRNDAVLRESDQTRGGTGASERIRAGATRNSTIITYLVIRANLRQLK